MGVIVGAKTVGFSRRGFCGEVLKVAGKCEGKIVENGTTIYFEEFS
jgi:hypothetical protein